MNSAGASPECHRSLLEQNASRHPLDYVETRCAPGVLNVRLGRGGPPVVITGAHASPTGSGVDDVAPVERGSGGGEVREGASQTVRCRGGVPRLCVVD